MPAYASYVASTNNPIKIKKVKYFDKIFGNLEKLYYVSIV